MTPPGARTPTRPRPTPAARPRPAAPARRPAPQTRRPAPPRRPRPRRTTPLGRPPVRLRAALVLLAVVLSLYVVRLFEVQGLQAPVYAADAAEGRTVTRTLPAARGTITDRNGVVLAESVGARDITADPTFVKDAEATVAELAPILGLDETERLDLEVRLTSDKRFEYVAHAVTPATWERVKALDLAGIYGVATSDRVYPPRPSARTCSVSSTPPATAPAASSSATTPVLSGVDGTHTYQRDVQGREISTADSSEVAPIAGSDIAADPGPRPAVVRAAGAGPGREERQCQERHRRGDDARRARSWRWPPSRRSTPTTPGRRTRTTSATARSPTSTSRGRPARS